MLQSLERAALKEAVVRDLGRAVASDRLTTIAPLLAHLAAEGAFHEPGLFAAARLDRYARKLLWRDARARFNVVAITWGPGQRTPLHDHGRSWGADVVVRGVIHERQYRLVERTLNGFYRFSLERETALQPTEVGIVIPPLEYHSMENRGSQVAHSIHVYRKELRRARVFDEYAPQLWKAHMRGLIYDEQ